MLAGCSYIFDDGAPAFPLLGDPILPSRYPQMNVQMGPARDVYLLQGAETTADHDSYWAALPEAQPEVWPPPEHWPEHVRLIRLVDGVREDKPVSPGGADALAALEIGVAATLSAREGRPVTLAELR